MGLERHSFSVFLLV